MAEYSVMRAMYLCYLFTWDRPAYEREMMKA